MTRVTQIPITFDLPPGAPICCCGSSSYCVDAGTWASVTVNGFALSKGNANYCHAGCGGTDASPVSPDADESWYGKDADGVQHWVWSDTDEDCLIGSYRYHYTYCKCESPYEGVTQHIDACCDTVWDGSKHTITLHEFTVVIT